MEKESHVFYMFHMRPQVKAFKDSAILGVNV